jgi:uncharacterized protein (TIGR04222 family)
VNPLDWSGPEFLLFYTLAGATALVLLRLFARTGEAPGSTVSLDDPYQIAYLRGGPHEATRLAVVSLVDRGLLEPSGERLRCASGVTPRDVRRPLEKALVKLFGRERAAAVAYTDADTYAAAELLRGDLERRGLLPDPSERAARRVKLAVAVSLLWIVAAAKLVVALSRGRHNFVFLIMLAALFGVIAWRIHSPRRTRAGDAQLADLRTLMRGLRERAALLVPGGATAELVLLAAVFGLTAVPAARFPFATTLFPKATRGDSGSSSSGSACGASCGSSCGSSCGGGCGGGCGGCGS